MSVARSVGRAVDTSGVDTLHLRGEVGKVGLGVDVIAVETDQTIVVHLLEVHVNNATAPHVVHLRTKQNGNVGEPARTRVNAAILREECGNRVVLEFLSAILVPGGFKARSTTPFVDVVAKHINAAFLIATNQVILQVLTKIGVVVGGITDSQGITVALGLDVCLCITHSSLDEYNRVCVGIVVGDLVSSEEPNDIGVVGEGVHYTGVTVIQIDVPGGVGTVDRSSARGRQIGDEVDASIGEQTHAPVVVLVGVYSVGSDDVGAQLLEIRDVALTVAIRPQRVGVVLVGRCGSICRVLLCCGLVLSALRIAREGQQHTLIGDTTDETMNISMVLWEYDEYKCLQFSAVVGVEEFVSLWLSVEPRYCDQSLHTLITISGRSAATAVLARREAPAKARESFIVG